MEIKLGVIIGIVISFLFSLFIDGARSFLLSLPGRILRYFQNKNFKCYKLFLYNPKEIKGLIGKYYFCSFDNKTYIINTGFLPSEKLIYKSPILNKELSSTTKETIKEVQENNQLEVKTEKEYNLTIDDLIEILDGFSLYKQEKQTLFLSETLYTAIRNKLQKRKISLSIYSENNSLAKIPFCELSERDFGCLSSKLSIEKGRN